MVVGILTLIMRVSLLGLDKGLLWWLPAQPPGHQREGIGAALILCTVTCALAAALVTVGLAPWIAAWAERPDMTDARKNAPNASSIFVPTSAW